MSRQSFNISLDKRWKRVIEDQIATGRYESPGEVIRDGLRLVEERSQQGNLDRLRHQIELAWLESENDPGVDGEAFMKDLEVELKSKMARQTNARKRS